MSAASGSAMAQTFRRWTVLGLSPFTLTHKRGREEWDRLPWDRTQAREGLRPSSDFALMEITQFRVSTPPDANVLLDRARHEEDLGAGQVQIFRVTQGPMVDAVHYWVRLHESFESNAAFTRALYADKDYMEELDQEQLSADPSVVVTERKTLLRLPW